MTNDIFSYKLALLFLSGGKGRRFGSDLPKQYHLLDGKPVALHSLETFLSLNVFSQVVIVTDSEFEPLFPKDPRIVFAQSGSERQDSLLMGSQKLKLPVDFVCIHDAARPFVKKEDIIKLLEATIVHKAATLAVRATDTIKMVDDDLFVLKTLDRKKIYHSQTPQAMSYELLQKGLAFSQEKKIPVTDDVSLAELLNYPVKIVEGSLSNIKITTREDLPCNATK